MLQMKRCWTGEATTGHGVCASCISAIDADGATARVRIESFTAVAGGEGWSRPPAATCIALHTKCLPPTSSTCRWLMASRSQPPSATSAPSKRDTAHEPHYDVPLAQLQTLARRLAGLLRGIQELQELFFGHPTLEDWCVSFVTLEVAPEAPLTIRTGLRSVRGMRRCWRSCTTSPRR